LTWFPPHYPNSRQWHVPAHVLNVLYSTFSSVLFGNGRPEIQHFKLWIQIFVPPVKWSFSNLQGFHQRPQHKLNLHDASQMADGTAI
jgi:hypothetical protein